MAADLRNGDTIVAIASGQGRAAIVVVRLSGPQVGGLLERCLTGLPSPRRASLRALRDPSTGEVLDRCLALWMPGPASFTGEDQAELHCHGGIAVRSAVIRMLLDQPGCRAAEPGEFTRRAFLNGRLDLTAVEGLADLIEAETEAQRRQAFRQMEGGLSSRVFAWRDALADALALCEASLDFSDEADVPADVAGPALAALGPARAQIASALAGSASGERVREGFMVVIAGPPNAGKSSLLNAIARRDVAIVSDVPGTTRDAIEVRCDLDGWPVTFVDTAGLRETDDPVEREGVSRARARLGRADLVLWLSAPDGGDPTWPVPGGPDVVQVATKSDLRADDAVRGPAVSARTGQGLSDLLAAIRGRASAGSSTESADAVLTRERHRQVLTQALACLDRALAIAPSGALELVAEDLRLALRALGRMTGHVDVEEILARIFASFCIGK